MKNKLLIAILILTLLATGCSPPTAAPTTIVAEPFATSIPETSAPTEAITQSASPTPAPREFSATFEQGECPFDVPADAVDDVQCGFVVVPEDHADPAGETIRLAVVVVKDRSPAHQPDPVILLAGGPGEKVVANAVRVAVQLAPIHPNRDLVIFDQRGVGLSEPALECPEFMQAMLDLLDESEPEAAAKIQFNALMACRDRLVKEGYNLSAYTTQQNAADVNAIRVALGYDLINLHGSSYGSHLAQAVMRDYPQRIRSIAINSVWPLEKSLSVDGSTTFAQAILHLLDSCQSDEACNNAYPDLQEKLFEVIDRLNDAPVPISITNPVDGKTYDALLTGDGVLGNLSAFLYVTRIIPILPQAIYDLYNEDYELISQLSGTRLALLSATTRGMMFSVLCTEDLVGKTPQSLLDVKAALPDHLSGMSSPEVILDYGIFAICENWPVEQAGSWVKDPVTTDIPTLVLEGEFDPVTPPEYGRLVAGYLDKSFVYEFPGLGHDVLSNECVRTISGSFIQDPTRPPEAACMEKMPQLVFDLPAAEAPELVLEPFSDPERGFSGLVPAGWQEFAPANMARQSNALDPAYFVLEAVPGTKDELFANLAAQLALGEELQPTSSAQVGNFTWDFYSFERGGNPSDLAMAEDGEKAYFVYMTSKPDEHERMVEQLFMPAVEAMASLD
jgi:pimeloyl-ACP methyl ester carboxylesterase